MRHVLCRPKPVPHFVTANPRGRSRPWHGQALEWYRSAHLVVRSNLSRIDRRRQANFARRPPEHSAIPDSDAEAIFHQAVDRNFVSRLALEVAATLGVVDRILAGVTGLRELASDCQVDPTCFCACCACLRGAAWSN